jgi:hypothetical protein
MTEAEWLVSQDPEPMLAFLGDKASQRKLRLFACACCRRIWAHLTARPSRRVVEVSENYADGRATRRQLTVAWEKADFAFQGIHLAGGGDVDQAPAQAVVALGVDLDVAEAVEMAAATLGALARGEAYERIWKTPGKEHTARWAEDDAVRLAAEAVERRAQADLLRDVIGNPFRSVRVDPSCLRGRRNPIVGIAEACYAEEAFDRLPVLADLLEEAGCTDAAILTHCRGGGVHVRGCWVVDLILGKG